MFDIVCNDPKDLIKKGCVDWGFLDKYAGLERSYLYANIIENAKRYDKPKELGEFRKPCKMGDYPCCGICDYAVHGMDGDLIDCDTSLTRPPQSWCYVEEIQNG